jgi:hypothetical protein
MPLKKIPIKAGFNKQDTCNCRQKDSWIDGDFTCVLDMATPEKIGGWQQLTPKTLAGCCKESQHIMEQI